MECDPEALNLGLRSTRKEHLPLRGVSQVPYGATAGSRLFAPAVSDPTADSGERTKPMFPTGPGSWQRDTTRPESGGIFFSRKTAFLPERP